MAFIESVYFFCIKSPFRDVRIKKNTKNEDYTLTVGTITHGLLLFDSCTCFGRNNTTLNNNKTL